MINYWLERSREIIEKEVLLARKTLKTDLQTWFDKMPARISVVFCQTKTKNPDHSDLETPVGYVHHLKMMKLGIEGVLKAPKFYHRYPLYLLYYPRYDQAKPFWAVVHKS